MPKSTKPRYGWVYAPAKASPPSVPAAMKRTVEERANALVASVLKPRYVQPPPEDPQFNYIEDIVTKWRGSYFYFCAVYRSAGPHALGGQFETKFARMKYTGGSLFDLAYMRHTDAWFELLFGKTLEECLESIESDPWFQP